MLTIDTKFQQELTKLIDAEIERLTETLVLGAAIADIAAYTKVVGQIMGLELAKDQFDEANRILSER